MNFQEFLAAKQAIALVEHMNTLSEADALELFETLDAETVEFIEMVLDEGEKRGARRAAWARTQVDLGKMSQEQGDTIEKAELNKAALRGRRAHLRKTEIERNRGVGSDESGVFRGATRAQTTDRVDRMRKNRGQLKHGPDTWGGPHTDALKAKGEKPSDHREDPRSSKLRSLVDANTKRRHEEELDRQIASR